MSDRHQKLESFIRELTARFILTEANSDPLITITHVNISEDSRKATVFFTTIPEDREQDALIFMKRTATDLRDYIKKHSNMKMIPHLEFFIDGDERIRQHEEGLI